jgi:type VI secretion system FHA domain protein
MPLTLKIVSKQRHILGADSVRVFSVHGGSIGRSPDSDWVLPDPDRYISGHHARIDYRDGAYYLRDTSTNGVFVNRSDQAVGRGNPIRLYDGDELRMGDYLFQVGIVNVSRDGADDSGESEGDESRPRIRRKQEDPSSLSLKLLGEQGDEAGPQEDPAASEAFAATVRFDEDRIDTKLDVDRQRVNELRLQDSAMLRLDEDPPPQAAPRTFTASGPRDFTEAVRLLLESAGLDPAQMSRDDEEKIVVLMGRLVRSSVDGLQSLLRSRAITKAQFRISQTGFHTTGNNPLKLMNTTQEALEQMFHEGSEGYLGPVESVEEACRDLRIHQAATLKALQQAVRGLLDRLEPEALEERFQQGAKSGGLLSGSQKARYWELYRDAYQSIAGFSDDNFASVLGAKFADAYDREVQAGMAEAARKRR